MPLRTTIFAPATLLFVAGFLVALLVTARLLHPRHPRPISHFPDAWRPAENEVSPTAVPGVGERPAPESVSQ